MTVIFLWGGGGEVRGVPISSSLEDNVESAILFTQGFSAPPTGREKPWERGWGYPNPILVINYHVHMIPIQRVKIWVLLERCLEF